MRIDEYVIGKGAQNKSFCYEIENGKYKDLYLSIKGGTAGKFGIYSSHPKNKVDRISKTMRLLLLCQRDIPNYRMAC